jgi:hypothetical protein
MLFLPHLQGNRTEVCQTPVIGVLPSQPRQDLAGKPAISVRTFRIDYELLAANFQIAKHLRTNCAFSGSLL